MNSQIFSFLLDAWLFTRQHQITKYTLTRISFRSWKLEYVLEF